MRRALMNRPGPLARDWRKLKALVEELGGDCEIEKAQTGTVYVRVFLRHGEFERCYRFASHAECYSTHDYSVASGSTVPRDCLPPGYDGYAADALADLLESAGLTPVVLRRLRRARLARDRRLQHGRYALMPWDHLPDGRLLLHTVPHAQKPFIERTWWTGLPNPLPSSPRYLDVRRATAADLRSAADGMREGISRDSLLKLACQPDRQASA